MLRSAKEDDGAVLLVDVAGGRGHDLEAFRQKFPDARGRMILQDLSGVVDDIRDLDLRIERMAYDMFLPQPIEGEYSPTLSSQINYQLKTC